MAKRRGTAPQPWEDRWRVIQDGPSGGQGKSFLAVPRDGGSGTVFIKTILRHRRRNDQARRRFKAEAAAYEALAGLGPPALFDHNAEAWDDPKLPMLYMALEYIPGPNLREHVGSVGPGDPIDALACLRELALVTNNCHQRGFIHRDIKPLNIVLRDGDLTRPALVDFGLSFNDESEDDVTRVDEEVGNKFLRLPENSLHGRYPSSDVTQLAGVFLFILTGMEPRVLSDENMRMPHQRPDIRAALESRFVGRQLLRLMRVFDRAFTQEISKRYLSAPELVTDLEKAMETTNDDGDDLENLESRVSEITSSQNCERYLRCANSSTTAFCTSWMQRWLPTQSRKVSSERGGGGMWRSRLTNSGPSNTSHCLRPIIRPISSNLE